jgi:hypothetical protein
MKTRKWFSLLVSLAALCAAALVNSGCSNKMTMLALTNGKVYPSPAEGDVLTFVDQKHNPLQIQWLGIGPDVSPCKEQQGKGNTTALSSTCTIHYLTKSLRYSFYTCPATAAGGPALCIDPIVPGPDSGSNPMKTKGPQSFVAPRGANIYNGQASPTASGASSGVYYFPNNGENGGLIPIPVNTYSGTPARYDQVVYAATGAPESSQVQLPSAKCLQSPTTALKLDGYGGACTVTATASFYYCAKSGTNTWGIAEIDVSPVGVAPVRPVNPPPSCPLP